MYVSNVPHAEVEKITTNRRGFPCYLDGVEPAVAIEGKADDVCWVLVPAGID